MAIKHIHDAPDADAIAILALCYRRHVSFEYCVRRRNSVRPVPLQRFPCREIFRPDLPGDNKRNANTGLVGPFDHCRSRHKFLLSPGNSAFTFVFLAGRLWLRWAQVVFVNYAASNSRAMLRYFSWAPAPISSAS